MDASLPQRTMYFVSVRRTFSERIHGEPIELWGLIVPAFSCRSDDLRRYMEGGRWDLVLNALCYLTVVVEEGSA